MIENRWSDAECARRVAQAGEDPADIALAERVYSSRLIGQDPDLVMHGGGNTSVKVQRPNLFGEMEDVLHVKGSGWDLDTIEAAGLPGVRLAPLHKLRALSALGDEQMVNAQRSNLLNSSAPNPSVETLLHAYLPHRFVDHTHATPFLILANLPNAAEVAREIFGTRLGIVPYIMPGFALAKAAAEVYESDPSVEGLLLLQHGHFAFGESARESYERIIAHTNEAARALGEAVANEPTPLKARSPGKRAQEVLPLLRGVLADRAEDADAPAPLLDLRNGAWLMRFLERPDLPALATRGVASPDHVIRIKARPLMLNADDLKQGRAGIEAAVDGYMSEYDAYFSRQNARVGGTKKRLSPLPQVAWIAGVGLVGIGATAPAASVAADLGEQNCWVRAHGEQAGGFRPIGEDDLFDMEYWSLEQAKLGKAKRAECAGRVVLITGGAGAIGLATAKAFADLGANVVLSDADETRLNAALDALGGQHVGIAQDITTPNAAQDAVATAVQAFGGLDILIANAGSATTGAMLDLDANTLRAAFELNFFAHHAFATTAARLMKKQGRGGQILFNISKQSVNPGRNFGAYGLPKASTLFLMRQLALELGGEGVRVNGINADRIRSGIVTNAFIASRAEARGTDEASYMAGNLLQREVKARHVAEGFVALSRLERTTGHVITIDGGNMEAALR